MHAIVTRFWTFRYAAVHRRWVPNCATCTSPRRHELERLADATPLMGRGRGFYSRVLRAVSETELTPAALGRHFGREHLPLVRMAQIRWGMADEAGRLARRTGVSFEEALDQIKAPRLAQHDADWQRYLAGPQDDLRHLLHHPSPAVKNNRSRQDSVRPSARLRAEWGVAPAGGADVYTLFGFVPPDYEELQPRPLRTSIFEPFAQADPRSQT